MITGGRAGQSESPPQSKTRSLQVARSDPFPGKPVHTLYYSAKFQMKLIGEMPPSLGGEREDQREYRGELAEVIYCSPPPPRQMHARVIEGKSDLRFKRFTGR